jgi:hypothetical protein
MTFREIITVNCEIHRKPTNTMYGEKCITLNIKERGTHTNHSVLRG